MQSPFLDEAVADVPEATTPAEVDQLTQLQILIQQGLEAKREAEQQKARYDAIRDQVCAILRDLGTDKVQTSVGIARLKETKSGWEFSAGTTELAKQLKVQQDVEKKIGTAKPTKITLSADLFA